VKQKIVVVQKLDYLFENKTEYFTDKLSQVISTSNASYWFVAFFSQIHSAW